MTEHDKLRSLLAREAMRRRQEAETEAREARSAREHAEREERAAAFLASAGLELAKSLDYEQTIATLARLLVPNLGEMSVVDIASGSPDGQYSVSLDSSDTDLEPRTYSFDVWRTDEGNEQLLAIGTLRIRPVVRLPA